MTKYNPTKRQKVLIVFDDMIPDMMINKNLYQTVTELEVGNFLSFLFLNHTLKYQKILDLTLHNTLL